MNTIIAIPTQDGNVCPHFGHCEAFAIVEVENDVIKQKEMVKPPQHQPGSYPRFLMKLGVQAVLAGGMGMKAQQLFQGQNIAVYTGVGAGDIEELVTSYISGKLQTGNNACDH